MRVNLAFGVKDILSKGKYVSAHMILNQCGSLLARSNQKMKVYGQQRNFQYTGV